MRLKLVSWYVIECSESGLVGLTARFCGSDEGSMIYGRF